MNAVVAGLAALHFLRPQWLWALAALPLLAWWWRARRRRRSVWRDAVDPHLLPHLLEAGATARLRAAPWLGLLGVALALVALAGPSWRRSEQPLWQSRAPLVIALDLSPATLAGDLPPSRLLQARAKLATLLKQRAGGQVGLVVFADDAYTVAPLTEDVANVALFLDALAPDVMPAYGSSQADASRADRAIAWSAKLLRQAGFGRGDILLLSDRADAAARRAAAKAAEAGYRVSALGLGTAAGAAYRDADGRIVQARLQAGSLRALAAAGGGRYAALSPGAGDLGALGVLAPRQAGAIAARGEKTLVWRDQGYWLLPPLLLLALLAFRRGGALALLLACLWLPWQPLQAAQRDWWLRPEQRAQQRLERGVQAYRKNDFAAAETIWAGVPGADAAYNRGNALAKAGAYAAAIAAYDAALRLQPGMADAIANRRAVRAAQQRKPPPGPTQGRQNQPQNKRQGNPRNGQNPGGQTAAQSQSPSPASPERKPQPAPSARSARPGDTRQGTPSDQSGAVAAQRAADAAQRARMRRALARAQPGQPQPPPQARRRTETALERERRLANEAWLRRVADDPGGLLRAKLRLEYQRRQQAGN